MIKRLFSPPVFDNEEDNFRAKFINGFAWSRDCITFDQPDTRSGSKCRSECRHNDYLSHRLDPCNVLIALFIAKRLSKR